ncbi:hypothetical protein PCE1_003711 [Barthelona sp. PCE]
MATSLRFLIVGDSGVGKSSILSRYCYDDFNLDNSHTIGVDLGNKTTTVDDNVYRVQIWDTAGQDRFRAVVRAYFRSAVAVVLCYDVTVRSSFHSLNGWLTDCRNSTSSDVVIMVVGNKTDIRDEDNPSVVSYEELKSFAEEGRFLYRETSAATGENVEDVFNDIIREIASRKTIVTTLTDDEDLLNTVHQDPDVGCSC